MRYVAAVIVVVVGASGCSQSWILRREYTTSLSAEPGPGSELSFSPLFPAIKYADLLTCEGPPGSLKTSRDTEPSALPLRITNPTAEIVTLDWDHTAFVDGSGQSYRLMLLNAPRLPANVEAIKKPNAPVLAPGAHVDVLVYPEPPDDRLFFLPRMPEAKTTFRIAFATVGSAKSHSEARLTATLTATKEMRSREFPWPRAGEECLPLLGCDAGLSCGKAGRCVAPAKQVVPRVVNTSLSGTREVEPFGGRCTLDSDCLSVLACIEGRCGARE